MCLVQTNDPSEFWMCLRLPKYERRHKHFVGKERTRHYQVKKAVVGVIEHKTREYSPAPLSPLPPLTPREQMTKTMDSEFIGPFDLRKCDGEGKLAWARRWIAYNHGITVSQLESDCRIRRFVAARQEYFYYAHIELGFSLPKIGEICSDRDHTTVLHGVRKHAERFGKPMRDAINLAPRDETGKFCALSK